VLAPILYATATFLREAQTILRATGKNVRATEKKVWRGFPEAGEAWILSTTRERKGPAALANR